MHISHRLRASALRSAIVFALISAVSLASPIAYCGGANAQPRSNGLLSIDGSGIQSQGRNQIRSIDGSGIQGRSQIRSIDGSGIQERSQIRSIDGSGIQGHSQIRSIDGSGIQGRSQIRSIDGSGTR
jgi:hypothetical protein